MEKEAAVQRSTDARPDPAGRALFAAAASALLFSSTLVLPLLFVLGALAPFPIAVQRLRGTVGSALMAALAASAIVAIVFTPGHAVTYLVMWALPGLAMGEAMARGRGLRRATLWTLLLVGIELGILLVFANNAISAQVLGPWDFFRSAPFLDELRSAGVPPEQVDAWVENASAWRSALEVVYPAAFLIAGAVMVLGNAWLLRTYLARRDPGWLEGGEFEGLRWPLGMAVAFVAAGGAVLSPVLRPAAYNALLVLAFFFALQGLAVVAYYVHRLAAPAFLRLVVLALVILNPWAPQILALAGLFDIFIDFRKWAEPPVEES